jgi:anti-sigma factor (TIGR02949 family)
MNNCEEIREQLTLYLDNELQGDERSTVATHLQICESCRKVLDHEREFVEAIRQARPHYVAPPELRTKIVNLLQNADLSASSVPDQADPGILNLVPKRSSLPPKRFRLNLGWAIAATILVLLVPVIVWLATVRRANRLAGQPSSFALMAADTHMRRVRRQLPLELESESPNEISQWFSNKVNFTLKLPNYQESSGQNKLYTLEGARLVGFKDDYAAYVAYRMSARPISLVITSDSVATPSGGEEIAARGLKFHYDAIQGLKVITWSDRGLTYALVSDFEERGQQSCIVCHQGTKDRDFIEQLKPRS